MEGWIKLHRKLNQCWLWTEKPFSKGQAWVDLPLMANHKDNKVLIGNNIIEVKRGEFITSEVKLSNRWGWSRKKVRSFLEVLETDKMLTKKATTKYTTLSIENYDLYQSEGTTKEQQKNSNGTSKEHQKNTNKNDKNDNNVKNDKNIYSGYTTNPDLLQALNDFEKMRNKMKKPMTDRAKKMLLNKLHELDNSDTMKISLLEQSILKGWTDVYELKEGANAGLHGKDQQADKFANYDKSKWVAKPDDTNTDLPY